MRSRLVFFAAVWRGLFFLGYCRFVSSRRQASGDSPPNRPKPCTPSLSTRANFSARAPCPRPYSRPHSGFSATPIRMRSDPACSRSSRSGRPWSRSSGDWSPCSPAIIARKRNP